MKIQFENIFRNFLVIDIETASIYKNYSDMDERMKTLWDKKASFMQNQEDKTADELYFDKGAIFAEFGKVICISAGVFTKEKDNSKIVEFLQIPQRLVKPLPHLNKSQEL